MAEAERQCQRCLPLGIMKRAAILLLLACCTCKAQVYIKHKIPSLLATGRETPAELVINRPPLKDFAMYELSFQAGLVVREISCDGGTFRSENNRVRITWSIAPKKAELRITLNMVAGAAGTYTLQQQLQYQEAGEKKVAYFKDLLVTVQSGAEPEVPSEFQRLNQEIPLKVPVSRIDSIEKQLSDPEKVKMHVEQLRRDASQARRVGEDELAAADRQIEKFKADLQNARGIKKEEERKKAILEAENNIQKAEMNRQVAAKIISLSQSLSENADEIEKAGLFGSNENDSGSDSAAVVLLQDDSLQGNDIEVAGSEANVVYRIQIGAYGHYPARTGLASLGMVHVVNEEGLYKVLLGAYNTRNEAVKMQQQLATKGVDGFIVKYSGERRLK